MCLASVIPFVSDHLSMTIILRGAIVNTTFKNNTIVSLKDVLETVPLCVVSATINVVVNKTLCIYLKFWSERLGATNLMYSF